MQLLELVYGQGEASFIVLLPDSVEGLPKLEKDLTQQLLNAWMTQTQQEEVEVHLPRYTHTHTKKHTHKFHKH